MEYKTGTSKMQDRRLEKFRLLLYHGRPSPAVAEPLLHPANDSSYGNTSDFESS